ncbi:uncharacterized protein LOC131218088 [Magnolia sinica]|uniref:uncharacterized protein LOC131218088 n=1 Tax=Magnolia sinica TaxID=86752 RepID=UPI0026593E5C|nr:uncharacterized protein LOC131218088 [Magnolia sinica]
MDPLKYLFEKPTLTGSIAKWQLLLLEFDITYVTQKAIKGQALADHLAAHSLPDYQPLKTFFPDKDILLIEEGKDKKAEEWTLFFDGAANSKGSRVGAILYSPEDILVPISRRLAFQCTNNVGEYEACIAGLKEAIILNVRKLRVFGDSQLIINQINGNWRTKDEKLIPYHVYLENLVEEFNEITFSYMPRVKNQFVDALATLASMLEIPKGVAEWELTLKLQEEPAFYLQIDEAELSSNDRPWYTSIKKYLEHQKYPEGATLTDRRTIQRLAAQYVITRGILYKRSFNQILLRRVDETEAAQIIKCFKCQEHANQIHAPAFELYNLTAPWPFSIWGLDIIGKINPKASNGHEYILVAVDYFTKWIEAASYTTIATSHVVKFMKNNIISHYGVPQAIIANNGTPFVNKGMGNFLDKLKIQCHRSSPYRPQMNGGVEAANKTIIRILEKMVKTEWKQTSVRFATYATPYELVYRMETVLPVEIEIPSLRILLESGVEEVKWQQARYDQLHLADEKRMQALSHSQCYQRRIARAYNKRVQKRSFKVIDMVMKRILPKFKPSWEGPLIIREVLQGGALRLTNLKGEDLPEPINTDNVKIYHR